jgi:hypothetical protein
VKVYQDIRAGDILDSGGFAEKVRDGAERVVREAFHDVRRQLVQR